MTVTTVSYGLGSDDEQNDDADFFGAGGSEAEEEAAEEPETTGGWSRPSSRPRPERQQHGAGGHAGKKLSKKDRIASAKGDKKERKKIPGRGGINARNPPACVLACPLNICLCLGSHTPGSLAGAFPRPKAGLLSFNYLINY